uniref:Peptidase_M1 domain-containing protein n=1 Tax=Rhabditophanes sp. KR3021 TaxID=114890 RepID=A0AC35TLG6_9BILA
MDANFAKYGRWIHTLFETSYARQLFPCFDEPKFRSAFKLQLWLYAEYAKPSYTALSNTNGIPYKFNENLTIWTFNDTPSLPTYLFTIAIGKFDHYCCSSELDMDQNICIWKLVNVENHLWYNVADKVCDQASIFQANTENYVGINTGARLHFLIIPTYLNGMENFGLLIVSERLWPRENNKYSYIAFEKTLKHEMAHQFFGNLVTMEWWNDIWLSESLTCFLALPKLHQHRYDMDLSEDSIIDKRWAEKIPRIVYVKGAAVLSMLENVIEPSNMRLLLQVYLSRYYFQSASTKNFVEILKQVTRDFREEAPEFLMSWLTQGSYPLVFINYDQNNQQFILSQTPKVGDISRRWLIPIWIDCAGGTVNETLYWIPKHSDLVIKLDEVTKTNQTAAITFNNNRIVYYGIVYKYVTE